MKRIIIALLLFLLSVLPIYSQVNLNADSLWKVWNNPALDASDRYQAIKKLAWDKYIPEKSDTCLLIANLIKEEGRREEVLQWQIDGIRLEGIYYAIKYNYKQAIIAFKKTIRLEKQHGKTDHSWEYLILGRLFGDLGDFPKSIEYTSKALDIYKETNNFRGEISAINNLAMIYLKFGDVAKAEVKAKTSLLLCNSYEIGKSEELRIMTSLTMGEVLLAKGEYEQSLEYFRKALSINKDLIEHKAPQMYGFMGEALQKLGKWQDAEKHINKGIGLYTKSNNKTSLATNLTFLGNLKIEMGLYAEAVDLCKRSLEIAEEINLVVENNAACACLFKAYREKGELENAIKYQALFSQTKDSIFSTEKIKAITSQELNFLHEKELLQLNHLRIDEKKQARIQLQKTIIISIAILSFLIIVSLIYFNVITRKRKNEMSRKNDELEKYIASNIRLQEFAHIVSHDLKAPLRIIHGFSTLLKKHLKNNNDETIEEYLGFITSNISNMQSLIDGILNYSSLTNEGEHHERILPEAIIEDLKRNYQENDNVRVEYDRLPEITGNKTQIYQLFQNLIDNSIKYNDKMLKKVEIDATIDSEHIVFRVKDNGIGISQSNQKKIFEMFNRLHSQEEYSGTGIGLATCKKIVELHKGEIWVESEKGVGSTFNFSLSYN
ncbi:MAG: ATP-binding protein [Bacteroidota bacterium]